MDASKASNRRQADQVKITLDIKPAGGLTPEWCRLWRLLLSSGPFKAGERPGNYEGEGQPEKEKGANGEGLRKP
jgi:hypothetical protein